MIYDNCFKILNVYFFLVNLFVVLEMSIQIKNFVVSIFVPNYNI